VSLLGKCPPAGYTRGELSDERFGVSQQNGRGASKIPLLSSGDGLWGARLEEKSEGGGVEGT